MMTTVPEYEPGVCASGGLTEPPSQMYRSERRTIVRISSEFGSNAFAPPGFELLMRYLAHVEQNETGIDPPPVRVRDDGSEIVMIPATPIEPWIRQLAAFALAGPTDVVVPVITVPNVSSLSVVT